MEKFHSDWSGLYGRRRDGFFFYSDGVSFTPKDVQRRRRQVKVNYGINDEIVPTSARSQTGTATGLHVAVLRFNLSEHRV